MKKDEGPVGPRVSKEAFLKGMNGTELGMRLIDDSGVDLYE